MPGPIHAAALAAALAAASANAAAPCDPDALFAPGMVIPLPPSADPAEIRAADLDADARTDLVITESGTRTVAVLLGNGDGTFQPAVRYGAAHAIGRIPTGLAVADLDADGSPDLAVGSRADATVTVLYNDGAGGFPAADARVFDAGFFVMPSDIEAADLDADGDLDLVVSSEGNSVRVLLNDGAGQFAPPVFHLVLGSVPAVALGDLNGDSVPDAAATDFGGNQVEVLFGDGFGGFGPANPDPACGAPADVQIADLDGDGHPDLAVACFFAAVTIHLNAGAGVFAAGTEIPTTGVPRALAIADFDADAAPDLFVATGSTNPQTVSLFLGDGGGAFQPERLIPGGNNASCLAVGDLNGDGAPDAAVAHDADDSLWIYLNTCVPGGCQADFAPPFGTLNFFDVAAFVAAFNAQDASADLAPPFGVFNFFDVAAFISLYNDGCP